MNAVVLAVTAAAATFVTASTLAPTASDAATSTTCGFGTGGAEASTLCWVDFSSYVEATSRAAGGQAFTAALPGGYTATFTLTTSDVAGYSTNPVIAKAIPTYSGSEFGTSEYVGIAGKAALYNPSTTVLGAGVHLALTNIVVKDSTGAAVTGYGVALSDAEYSDGNEELVFTSTANQARIDAQSVCGAGPTGIGTVTVTCNGASGTASNVLVVQSNSPTSVGASILENGGRQGEGGIALAFVMSKLTLNKTVASRFNSSDSFTTTVADSGGTTLGTASTGAATTSTTGTIAVIPSAIGSAYTLAESSTPTAATAYTQSWSCTNATAGSSTVLPTGSGISKTVAPAPGDAITCTLTNTAVPATINVTKALATARGANTDQFTVAVHSGTVGGAVVNATTNSTTTGSGTTVTAGTGTTGATNLTPGSTYTVTPADLVNGNLSNTAVAIAQGAGGVEVASNESAVKVTMHTKLAWTGVTSEFYLIVAGLLIGVGGLLMVAGRRRVRRSRRCEG